MRLEFAPFDSFCKGFDDLLALATALCRTAIDKALQAILPLENDKIMPIKRRMKKWILASFLIGGFFATYGQIPQLGDSADQVWSKDEERNLGRAAYNRLLRSGDIYQNDADIDYLSYLGNKIAASTDTRLGLTFYLTRSPQINAFAAPGGYIGVNAGLVLATDNEHELAGVLAHEIAHVSQSHLARFVLAAKNRRLGNAAAMIGAVLVASQADTKQGAAAISAIVAGETQQQINDTRRHEIEADREGQRLLEKAGFNVLGMQTFFGKLYARADNTPSYLLTHPLPQRRLAALDTLQMASKQLASRDEYYLFKARLRSALLLNKDIEHLLAEEKNSDRKQVREAAKYLSALQAQKRGRFDAALATLATMADDMRSHRDVQLLAAKLLWLSDKPEAAEAHYEKLWQRFSGDSIVAYDYGQCLLAQKKLSLAADILKNQVDKSQNPAIYWLYAEVLGKLGRSVEQHSMLIRHYKYLGEYEQALNQAKIAQQQTASDWKSRAIFESEVKEIQQLIEAQKELQ